MAKWGLSDPAPTSVPSKKKSGFGIKPNPTQPNPRTGFWVHRICFLTHPDLQRSVFFSFSHPVPTYALPPAFPFLPLFPPFSRSLFLFLSLGLFHSSFFGFPSSFLTFKKKLFSFAALLFLQAFNASTSSYNFLQ
jgi:hypothetical protein